MQPKSINDVFNAPEIFIGTIVREVGIIAARAILSILISDVVEYFNIGKTMNDVQIATTCDFIIETYPHYKPDDFKQCFKNAMKHKSGYDKLYDRLDGAIIMDWLKVYDKERTDLAMSISENDSKQLSQSNGANYQEYLKYLKIQADNGDKEAMKMLVEKQNGDLLKKPYYLSYKARRNKQFYKK